MKRRIILIGIIILSCSAIIIGIVRGEVQTVLQKATRVCLECIGIG